MIGGHKKSSSKTGACDPWLVRPVSFSLAKTYSAKCVFAPGSRLAVLDKYAHVLQEGSFFGNRNTKKMESYCMFFWFNGSFDTSKEVQRFQTWFPSFQPRCLSLLFFSEQVTFEMITSPKTSLGRTCLVVGFSNLSPLFSSEPKAFSGVRRPGAEGTGWGPLQTLSCLRVTHVLRHRLITSGQKVHVYIVCRKGNDTWYSPPQ